MIWFWENKKRWIHTFSGVRYFPANPRVEDVRIVDIAHHLSMLCRFTGAVRHFYTVCEHSVLVSYLVPSEYALYGLLHDAAEAYLNDLSSPVKHNWFSLWGYRRLERKNMAAIAAKFGLPAEMPACVHEADQRMLRTEQCQLMPYCEHTPIWAKDAVPGLEVSGWLPAEGEVKFMNRFYELTRGLGSQCKPFAPHENVWPNKACPA